MSAANPVFCALDTTDPKAAGDLANGLRGLVGGVKLGLEFFCANGPAGVRAVAAAGQPLFLDLKLHDIPNTVAGAMRAILGLRPMMTTLHAAGGVEMVRAACRAADEGAEATGLPRPLILAVTVLTSLDDAALAELGMAHGAADQVKRLAGLAQAAGADGVVCSPYEVAALRSLCGPDFTLVVPGIRPAGSSPGDQKRVLTPAEALAGGADYLVVGRPITAAPDPLVAARALARTIGMEV